MVNEYFRISTAASAGIYDCGKITSSNETRSLSSELVEAVKVVTLNDVTSPCL
jgi:hypothetical protein